jgi:hypothetical protein
MACFEDSHRILGEILVQSSNLREIPPADAPGLKNSDVP